LSSRGGAADRVRIVAERSEFRERAPNAEERGVELRGRDAKVKRKARGFGRPETTGE